jgi:hypothetical protein
VTLSALSTPTGRPQTVLVLKYIIPDYQNPDYTYWGIANVIQSICIMTSASVLWIAQSASEEVRQADRLRSPAHDRQYEYNLSSAYRLAVAGAGTDAMHSLSLAVTTLYTCNDHLHATASPSSHPPSAVSAPS